nr:probable disease resistance protein At4g27220 [Quercus suber]
MDILTRCMGSIAAEVVKCAKPVIRHVGYLFRFKKIVDDLTKATKDLQLVQQKVEEAIKLAKMNTEVVEKDVEGWLTDVDQLMKEVQDLENEVQGNLRFCNDWCPDWIRQYKLCKEAIKKTNVVQEIQKKGNFSKVAHRAPTPGIEIFSSSDFEVFESRKLAFQQIMEALHDDNNKRIGLHGIGGVGKTTLVKEVYKKVKELNIFKDIVMIVVSQTPDVRRIQGEIADCLQLKLEEESDTARANRVCLRIKNVEKILIMLDDVWKDVNLEAIGIPSCDDHRGCKMLLTTRSVHVCNLMRCQRKIPLNFLVEEESLALMKKIAIVDDCAVLNDVVLKVVKECKGLPIAIITVGKALIGKSLDDWNAAMHRLRKSRLVDIEGVDEEKNAYACLKWSYDQLKRKTKFCFLLCSLFPEDYNIPIEELTRYAMGLAEDEDFHSLDEARSQVRAAINSLKDSFLLLEGFEKEFVKMHDMVRDIGLWITSEEKNEFKLRAYTRLERNTNLESATAISLIDYNTEQLPDNLECPRLKILLFGGIRSSKEISNALFKGMNCLQVLTLHDKILSSQSLKLLTNLRTLYLKGCNFSDDLSSLGKLKRLETLSFYKCGMVVLPSEFGEMESLKILDLTGCNQLKQIPPNVIRRLSQLEELFICESFKNWDVEGTTSEISNANLSELNSLPGLVILSLQLNLNHFPKGFVFRDLNRYYISINCQHRTPWKPHDYGRLTCIDSRTLEIEGLNASSMNALKKLFRTVEYIWIESCEMECIIDTICEGPNQYEIFSNLTGLVAHECPRLISLFSLSLAQSLKKLKQLRIRGCDEMKQVISDEEMILESHGQPICLSKLETLVVWKCGKLEYIFPISVARGLQQLERLRLRALPRLKKVFGQNREGEVGDCEIESHHQPTGFPKLETLDIWKCENLEYIFPISIAQDLPQLESLSLQDLPQLKQVFGQNREGEVGDCEIESHHQPTGFAKLKTLDVVNCGELEYIFPISVAGGLHQLERLDLVGLPRLKKVFGQNREGEVGDCEIESHHQPTSFPKLETILVCSCKNLEYIFPISIARDLPQLEILSLEGLPQLKQVFGHEEGGDDGDGNNSVLSKLRILRLENLPELVSLGGGDGSSLWPSLERLVVVNCPKVKLSFFANVEANVPALQKVIS